jgi:hypothetical protein
MVAGLHPCLDNDRDRFGRSPAMPPAVEQAEVIDEPTLELFLALQVGCLLRDQVGVRQCLRLVATTMEDAAGIELTRLLSNSLAPADRFWLGGLLGPRAAG